MKLGFFSLLFLLFLGLKLGGLITWSWLWICSPFWLPAVAAILILGTVKFASIIIEVFIEKLKA